MSDPTSAGTAAGIEERMARIEEALLGLLGQNQLNNNSPAPVPAASAPAESPGLFAEINQTASKSVLRPNAPFVFDGDRTQGQSFLHAVKTYVRLVPEGFLVDGAASEEKAVHFAMSYMAKDAAQRWAERHSAKIPFPFPTWADFVREFRLRFVEENEQATRWPNWSSAGISWAPATSLNIRTTSRTS